MSKRIFSLFMIVCLLVSGFWVLSPVPAARAAGTIIRVTTGGAAAAGCGTGWGNPCSLQYALNNVAVQGDEIWVAAGTYTPGILRSATFMLKYGVSVYGGFAGGEATREARNPASNATALSGNLGAFGNSYHVVNGSGTMNNTVLDGFTISGGNANGTSGNADGGGIYLDAGSPTLSNLSVEYNSASNNGGGIRITNNSDPVLANITLYHNMAGASGGGVAIWGSGSNPTLTNITFSGNQAAYGGGLSLSDSSDPTISHLTFSANTATTAGGAVDANNNTINIDDSIFWGDSSPHDAEISERGSSYHNLWGCVIQGTGYWGNGNTNADALLAAIGTYGGFTRVYALLPGSAAIDYASNYDCPLTDQRGVNRPQGYYCDSGAYEPKGFGWIYSGNIDDQKHRSIPTFQRR